MDTPIPEGLSTGPVAETTPSRRRQPRFPEWLPYRVQRFVMFFVGEALGVALKAYELAYGYRGSVESRQSSASRLLRNAKVRAAIEREMEGQRARAREQGDHALALVDSLWQFNVLDCLDERGRMLPLEKLPRRAAAAIKAVKLGRYGVELQFRDTLRAAEIRLKVSGHLRDRVEIAGKGLEAILSDSWRAHHETPAGVETSGPSTRAALPAARQEEVVSIFGNSEDTSRRTDE